MWHICFLSCSFLENFTPNGEFRQLSNCQELVQSVSIQQMSFKGHQNPCDLRWIWAKWGDAVKKVKLGRSDMRGDAFMLIESTSCPLVTVLDSSVCLIVFRWYYRPVVYLWTHIIPSLKMLMLINRLPQYLGQFPRRNRKFFSCTPLIFERDPLVSRLVHAVSHAAVYPMTHPLQLTLKLCCTCYDQRKKPPLIWHFY